MTFIGSVSRIPENSESKMIIIILAQIGVLKENSSTPRAGVEWIYTVSLIY